MTSEYPCGINIGEARYPGHLRLRERSDAIQSRDKKVGLRRHFVPRKDEARRYCTSHEHHSSQMPSVDLVAHRKDEAWTYCTSHEQRSSQVLFRALGAHR